MSIPEKLEEIQKLVEQETVECQRCRGKQFVEQHENTTKLMPCPDCHGTGKVPNPAFASLLEVVSEECPGCDDCTLKPSDLRVMVDDKGKLLSLTTKSFLDRVTNSDETLEDLYKRECQGSGYIPRSWGGVPMGALEGGLRWNLPLHWTLGVYQTERRYWAEVLVWQKGKKAPPSRFFGESPDNPDEAACDAMIAALREGK